MNYTIGNVRHFIGVIAKCIAQLWLIAVARWAIYHIGKILQTIFFIYANCITLN